ncbi:MAG: hypothetical protein LBS84_00080, partial [Clostridiales bacterium]|nr:hypothetical protein [Clostridiales bacterium]
MLEQYEQLRLAETPAPRRPKRKRKTPKVSAAVLVICVAASSLFGIAGGAAVNMLQSRNDTVIYTAPASDSGYHVTNLAAATGNSAVTIA